MGSTARSEARKFTYADYLTWPDDERWEIIAGEAWCMTPAPSLKHQTVAGNLFSLLNGYLRGKPCTPFIAPIDVVLAETDVVQPDIVIVCDKEKLTDANIQGAPDLVVEILSPSTGLKDRREKKALYERFGVREYLILNPTDETLERYLLADGRYGLPELLGWDETVRPALFPELEIRLWEVFGKEPPVSPDEEMINPS